MRTRRSRSRQHRSSSSVGADAACGAERELRICHADLTRGIGPAGWQHAGFQTFGGMVLGELLVLMDGHAERMRSVCAEAEVALAEFFSTLGEMVGRGGLRCVCVCACPVSMGCRCWRGEKLRASRGMVASVA